MLRQVTRRGLLKGLGIGCAGSVLAACQPKVVEVTSVVEKVVEKVVKETVMVEGTPQVVEKVVKETVVVSATAAPASKLPTEVSFEHFFQSPELWEPAFKDIFAYIEETYNVKVNHIPVPYNDMAPKLLTLIAGGTPPDLTSLDNCAIAGVAMRGALLPLDEKMAVDPPCDPADIMPSRLLDNTYDGKLYGIPIDQGSDGIYYNKALFDKAGLAHPTPAWTWDDLFQAAQLLTLDKTGKHAGESGFDLENIVQFGFNFDTSEYRLYNLVTSRSGKPEWFDRDVTKCLMDDPEIIDGFQYFVDLRCKHRVSPTAQQISAVQAGASGIFPFGLGYYAMEYTWVGMVSALKLEGVKIGNEWDVTTYPTGKKATATSGGQGFPIIKTAKQRDAAWDVIKGFMSEEVMRMLTIQGAWLPARISMANKFGRPADGVPEHYAEAFIDPVANYGWEASRWFVPGYLEWDVVIDNALNPCWMCDKTAEEAITELVPKLDELVAKREKPSA